MLANFKSVLQCPVFNQSINQSIKTHSAICRKRIRVVHLELRNVFQTVFFFSPTRAVLHLIPIEAVDWWSVTLLQHQIEAHSVERMPPLRPNSPPLNTVKQTPCKMNPLLRDVMASTGVSVRFDRPSVGFGDRKSSRPVKTRTSNRQSSFFMRTLWGPPLNLEWQIDRLNRRSIVDPRSMISKYSTIPVPDGLEILVLPSISDTSFSSLMMRNLQNYPTATVLNERM